MALDGEQTIPKAESALKNSFGSHYRETELMIPRKSHEDTKSSNHMFCSSFSERKLRLETRPQSHTCLFWPCGNSHPASAKELSNRKMPPAACQLSRAFNFCFNLLSLLFPLAKLISKHPHFATSSLLSHRRRGLIALPNRLDTQGGEPLGSH